MTKITVDKALIEQAIDALQNHQGNYKLSKAECNKQAAVEDALRSALVEPVVEPVAHATVRPLQPDECERKVIVKWVNRPVPGPLYASPPQPAAVPLLTEDEIDLIDADPNHGTLHDTYRAIEQAVRHNAGLK